MKTSSISNNLPDTVKQLLLMIMLGLISAALGMIEFKIPGMNSISSDLREIPLLIALFYCRQLWGVLIISSLTIISTPGEASLITYFIMHLIPLSIIFLAKKSIESKRNLSAVQYGLIWNVLTIAYYYLLIIPISIILEQWQGSTEGSFFNTYTTIVPTLSFEVITTTLITSLYGMQHRARQNLREQNAQLDELVSKRTFQLSEANQELQALNEELTASNEEVNTVNDNLESLVQERTKRLNAQLEKITRYTFMNSHHLRAPVARILGLVNLILKEENNDLKEEMLKKLKASTNELDEIIKSMNVLLDTDTDDDQ